MTTDDQVEKWAKDFMKKGIWCVEEEGSETIIESGLGKYKISKPLAECTKEDVEKALAPEIIADRWKGHGHGHDAHGNDIHDDGSIHPGSTHEGHSHEGHDHGHDGHGHGHDGHGHGHDDGHGAKGHGGYGHAHEAHAGGDAHEAHAGGDCCGGHGGEGHEGKEQKTGHGHDDHGEGHGHSHGHGHAHGHKEGEECAKIVGVGVVKLADQTFSVDREGQCESGKACEFGVELVGKGTVSGLEAWVEDAAGERVSDLVKAEAHGEHWHFLVAPQAGAQASKFALRCHIPIVGNVEGRVDIHPGAAPCHDGISTPIYDKGGTVAGFLELKLHDDAGDLEIWISRDGAMTQPMDIPADTIIKASFHANGGRAVDLKFSQLLSNEGRDGKPNMRDGKTNYFIFPGDSGADPSWLQGEKFRSMVEVTFAVGGETYETIPFTIVGHSQY